MKKKLVILMLCLTVGLTACGTNKVVGDAKTAETESGESANESDDSKESNEAMQNISTEQEHALALMDTVMMFTQENPDLNYTAFGCCKL